MAAVPRRQTLKWDPYVIFFEEGKKVKCLYSEKPFLYKKDRVMNHVCFMHLLDIATIEHNWKLLQYSFSSEYKFVLPFQFLVTNFLY